MARACSDDLRRKILQVYEQSKVSFQKVADRFGVSRSYVHKIRQQQINHQGKMERIPQSRNGPASRLTPEIRQQMRNWIAEQPDLTLRELQEEIKSRCQVSVSVALIWLVLQAMGLRLKKNPSTRRSKTRLASSRNGKFGARRWRGSTAKI
jgi:transposase